MSYETIQTALTALINATAIAGFGGIALHAFWTSHCKWMAEYCPPVSAPTLDAQPLTENLLIEIFQLTGSGEAIAPYTPEQPAIAEDIWDSGITTSAPRYWVRQPQSILPALALMPAKEEAVAPTRKTAKKSQPSLDVNLESLDAGTLRKLCTKYGIAWRNVRGQNRHATKGMMVSQLKAIA